MAASVYFTNTCGLKIKGRMGAPYTFMVFPGRQIGDIFHVGDRSDVKVCVLQVYGYEPIAWAH